MNGCLKGDVESSGRRFDEKSDASWMGRKGGRMIRDTAVGPRVII